MASISLPMRKQIERLLEAQPLEPNEFRRIEGMGSHFMSLSPAHGEVQHLFSMTIEGVGVIYIFKLHE